MKFRLVQNVDGQFFVHDFSEMNVVPAMAVRGFDFDGFSENPRLRPELQGQPKFKGVLGPMWGGEDDEGQPIVRYEDQSAYDRLSA